MTTKRRPSISALHRAVQRRTLPLVCAAYAVAVAAPGAGVLARHTVLLRTAGHGGCALPAALLGASLFATAAGVDPAQLAGLAARSRLFLAGMALNVLAPLAVFVLLAVAVVWFAADARQAQASVAGLALVAAMPVGGTAAAWTAHHRGNAALSLGLVLGSTAVSPVTVPFGLWVGSLIALGGYADTLRQLSAASYGNLPILLSTLIPCALGVLFRVCAGRLALRLLPLLRLAAALDILLLAYVNASGVLGALLSGGDLDFLALVCGGALALCAGSFGSGWLFSRRFAPQPPDAVALAYATGVENASMGAVIGGAQLAEGSPLLAPVLAVSLAQMLVAAVWARGRRRGPSGGPPEEPGPLS